ncbi:hypothetical protein E5Z02_24130, partial [Streptomyces rhizosphaericola]
MIFILTGEKLMDADEDLAFESRGPYARLGRKVDRLSSLIDKSIHDIGQSMPDDLAESYAKAMGMLVDDGGKNYLRDFSQQLDKIAEGRRKTSMDIMEAKWQVIAEIIRLLIEIAIYLAMSFFTGGASASQIMLAKMRSRFFILTTLSHLLQRLHLTPSLTEAFAEAFTTFAVRLAMMNFAPNGRRPDSIDWSDIGKAAAFGAAAGFFTSIFENVARNIVRSFDGNFLKNAPDLDFKNPNWRDTPGIDIKVDGPTPNPKPGPGPDLPKDRPGPELNPPGSGPGPTPGPVPVTFRDGPLSFRNNPELWRNSNILRFNLDRPGALAGHYGLKGTVDFIAAGAGEVVGEILIKGAFEGDWSSSWTTFVGAGVSSKVESALMGTALNGAAELRHVIDRMRLQQPPTVSGGASDSATRGAGNGPDRAEGPPRTDGTGGGGDAGLSSPPPVVQQTTGQGDFSGSQSPPPYVSQDPPPYVSQDPPPYFSADPPPYTPGPLPVTAAENALWQQVHQGPAEVREQALRDLAALRGSSLPGPAETGVRDGLHDRLSQVPEVRVVPGGNSPAGQVDTDAVRRALESLGTPVTVDTPLPGAGAQPSSGVGSPGGSETPVDGPRSGGGTPGGAVSVDAPGTETSSGPGRQTPAGQDSRTTAPPQVDTSGSYGDTRAPGETDGGPGTRDLGGDAPVTAGGPGTEAPPVTVVVSEGPPPLAASPEAAALLDGAGVDRAVVLGPPTVTD